jgi:hypothetical protein
LLHAATHLELLLFEVVSLCEALGAQLLQVSADALELAARSVSLPPAKVQGLLELPYLVGETVDLRLAISHAVLYVDPLLVEHVVLLLELALSQPRVLEITAHVHSVTRQAEYLLVLLSGLLLQLAIYQLDYRDCAYFNFKSRSSIFFR